PCHTYLLHPPGGIVGGDRLQIDVRVEPGAHGVVTTPAANKFYRSAGPMAEQRHFLTVAAGGVLEWLPQEQIAFDAARARSATRVDLAEGAAFIGWELTCLGRPAAGEGFGRGRFHTAFELWRGGRPLAIERNRLAGEAMLGGAWGLGGAPCTFTLMAVDAGDTALASARAVLDESTDRAAATLMDDVLAVRWLGDGAERGRDLLERLWRELRPVLLSRPAHAPRIWRT
ncbi:MAG TPA: urease accessory protein UreD, partial [Gammaproteobacteria bacterium]|nr:urease accessory protein UreD [Gammaproteobacteria bacterium]